jgi:hypothetical protein
LKQRHNLPTITLKLELQPLAEGQTKFDQTKNFVPERAARLFRDELIAKIITDDLKQRNKLDASVTCHAEALLAHIGDTITCAQTIKGEEPAGLLVTFGEKGVVWRFADPAKTIELELHAFYVVKHELTNATIRCLAPQPGAMTTTCTLKQISGPDISVTITYKKPFSERSHAETSDYSWAFTRKDYELLDFSHLASLAMIQLHESQTLPLSVSIQCPAGKVVARTGDTLRCNTVSVDQAPEPVEITLVDDDKISARLLR